MCQLAAAAASPVSQFPPYSLPLETSKREPETGASRWLEYIFTGSLWMRCAAHIRLEPICYCFRLP